MLRTIFGLLILSVTATLSIKLGVIDSFEFGSDTGRVTFSTKGSIGLLEKNVRVPIVIPYCAKLTYVRVDVNNLFGPPTVKVDFDASIVSIDYRILQYSRSTYTVTAKSIPRSNC